MSPATTHPIVERIERELGLPGLVDTLAGRLPASDLQSLLLEVYRRRAKKVPPAQALAAYEHDRLVSPALTSPVLLNQWEQVAYAHLPEGFEALALSPVCPLGTSASVAPVDPAWSVAAVRGGEVVSDSTNVLALECAIRRRALLKQNPKSAGRVHLAASHRLLRAQAYDNPRLVAHFSAFALASAGRDEGHLRFALEALGLHARFYLSALQAFLGPGVPLRFSVTDFAAQDRRALLEQGLLSPLRVAFTGATCGFDDKRTAGRGYYRDLCFHVHAQTPAGEWLELADGGCVDWTQRLLSNAKERLVISGIGSDRVCTGWVHDSTGIAGEG